MKDIQAWFDARIREMLQTQDPTLLLPEDEKPDITRIDALRTEIAEVERRIEGLLLQRLDTPTASQSVLTNLIVRADEQLQILRTNLEAESRREQSSEHQQRVAVETLEEITDMTLEKFWQQSTVVINRMLFALLGDNRVFIQNRQFVGIGKVQH